MAITVSVIVNCSFVPSTQTTLYTAIAGKTIIDKMTVSNVGASSSTFAANFLEDNQAPSAVNRTLPPVTIAVGQVYNCPEMIGHMLEEGQSLSTIAGLASTLSLRITARIIT